MHAKLEIIGAFMNLCVTYYGLVNWKSISQWHCVCLMLYVLLMAFQLTGNLTFYSVSMVNYMAIFAFTTHLPQLMVFWRKTEDNFLKEPYTNGNRRLSVKVRFTALAFFFVSMGEY